MQIVQFQRGMESLMVRLKLSLLLSRSIPFINSVTMRSVKGYVVSASPSNSSSRSGNSLEFIHLPTMASCAASHNPVIRASSERHGRGREGGGGGSRRRHGKRKRRHRNCKGGGKHCGSASSEDQ
uniref:Uncharacterized protein n=1 Tax=Physcomitrium patens TaxID=3218 RepID=A0A2K1J1X4_PHYPA|nr:hypothetical protein PHYPA_023422 [Physcomitrium patens]